MLYRLEQFEDCFDAYRDIIKNTDDDYEEERTTNLSAVVANLSIEGSVSDHLDFANTHCFGNHIVDMNMTIFPSLHFTAKRSTQHRRRYLRAVL